MRSLEHVRAPARCAREGESEGSQGSLLVKLKRSVVPTAVQLTSSLEGILYLASFPAPEIRTLLEDMAVETHHHGLFAMEEGEMLSPLTNVDQLVLTEAMSYEDPVLLKDIRVLSNILQRQDKTREKVENYFDTVQTEVKPHMRKIVTDWMLEVCEDQNCHAEVFSLAVNYLDRFMAKVNIQKSQFQLLATVCIFLASKFKETAPIPAENLVVYTDNSVSCFEITQWELIVLNVLDWDLSEVTPFAILDQLLRTLTFDSDFNMNTVRRHSETFVALAATEHGYFYRRNPVVVAAACLGAALRGLYNNRLDQVLDNLQFSTGVNTNTIKECMNQVEESISMSMSGLSFRPPSSSSTSSTSSSSSASTPVVPPNSSAPKIIPQHYNSNNGSKFTSTTPTDVMGVSAACVY